MMLVSSSDGGYRLSCPLGEVVRSVETSSADPFMNIGYVLCWTRVSTLRLGYFL